MVYFFDARQWQWASATSPSFDCKSKQQYSTACCAAKVYSKTASPACEIIKNEKKICARFVVAAQVQKLRFWCVMSANIRKEKALNLWAEDIKRKHVPVDGNVFAPQRIEHLPRFKHNISEEHKDYWKGCVCQWGCYSCISGRVEIEWINGKNGEGDLAGKGREQ